jgi:hypothetical protein
MPRNRSNAIVGAVKSGDILIKHNAGGLTGNLITAGQWLTGAGGKSKYMHSAIASSSVTVIEMSGDGLHENNLLSENAGYTYDAFRCKQSNLAEGAAEVGKMMMGFVQNNTGDIKYTIKGALKSLFGKKSLGNANRINLILDNLLAGGKENYFCSGHTVLCYVVAMEQTNIHVQGSFPVQGMRAVFGNESSGYNPAYLHDHLQKNSNFTFVGKVKAGQIVTN